MLFFTGLLFWNSGTFAQETETTIFNVGKTVSQLVPQFKGVSSTITFENQQQTVVGILTEPEMTPPYPIVLMFHGFTGQKDELPVHETEETMFSRTARVLAEQGIASIRIDFRGSGESDGEWPNTTFSGQISDVLAAIEYVANLPDIDPEHIGLLGLVRVG
jgi:dipeptidyl aminopeptidase/acylaminoacyl peptidase